MSSAYPNINDKKITNYINAKQREKSIEYNQIFIWLDIDNWCQQTQDDLGTNISKHKVIKLWNNKKLEDEIKCPYITQKNKPYGEISKKCKINEIIKYEVIKKIIEYFNQMKSK